MVAIGSGDDGVSTRAEGVIGSRKLDTVGEELSSRNPCSLRTDRRPSLDDGETEGAMDIIASVGISGVGIELPSGRSSGSAGRADTDSIPDGVALMDVITETEGCGDSTLMPSANPSAPNPEDDGPFELGTTSGYVVTAASRENSGE